MVTRVRIEDIGYRTDRAFRRIVIMTYKTITPSVACTET